MKLRYVKGQSWIQLPKAYINLLNVKRNDKFELYLIRKVFDQGSDDRRQELFLAARLNRAGGTSPKKRVAQIHVTEYMPFFKWVPGQRIFLSLDEYTDQKEPQLLFSHPIVTYGVPDFMNLCFKDLKKRIIKYQDAEDKYQSHGMSYDSLVNRKHPHPLIEPETYPNIQSTSGVNEEWGDLSKDLHLKSPDYHGD